METTTNKTLLTVEATVNAPVEKAWEFYTQPSHITNWNFASPDWHSPSAENDLRVGGKFNFRMEAKDGSFGFDFWGHYDEVKENEVLEYTMGDGRKAVVSFVPENGNTRVVTTFEAEQTHSIEMQQGGWQAILDNYKAYVESESQGKSKAVSQ